MPEGFMSVDDNRVELRGNTPREVVDVIDAVSAAERKSRMELVNEILTEWCKREVHKATVIGRVARGNPALAEAFRDAPEPGPKL